jgi:hypothetical protein
MPVLAFVQQKKIKTFVPNTITGMTIRARVTATTATEVQIGAVVQTEDGARASATAFAKILQQMVAFLAHGTRHPVLVPIHPPQRQRPLLKAQSRKRVKFFPTPRLPSTVQKLRLNRQPIQLSVTCRHSWKRILICHQKIPS